MSPPPNFHLRLRFFAAFETARADTTAKVTAPATQYGHILSPYNSRIYHSLENICTKLGDLIPKFAAKITEKSSHRVINACDVKKGPHYAPSEALPYRAQFRYGIINNINMLTGEPAPVTALNSDPNSGTNRIVWKAQRAAMEALGKKSQFNQPEGKRHWSFIEKLFPVVRRFFLHPLGLEAIGIRNARDIQISRIEISHAKLPREFDGFSILHLTDLHLDAMPGLEEIVIERLKKLDPVDLVCITGDFREHLSGSFKHILPPLKKIVDSISSQPGTKLGILGTLGNHDSHLMVEPFEELGIKMLCNESVTVKRGKEILVITGLDDVHYYYSDLALTALETAPEGFRVALVHSPEIVALTESKGYSLYLAGHTHGGQIALPSGKPIITHLSSGREFATGKWSHKNLLGYTSTGVGTSGMPLRFNTRGEIAVITLKAKNAI